MRTVYLNGEFKPVNEATVSVTDRGFLLGDGVYEVIPVYNKRTFRAKPHLSRLQRSLNSIKISYKVDIEEWLIILNKLIELNAKNDNDLSIYLQITRGTADKRTHSFPKDPKPTVFAQCTPHASKSHEELAKGGKAITTPDNRWAKPCIKSIALLPNVLATEEAKQAGANEAIYIRDGYATEGASSNLFVVKNNVIATPPVSDHILSGVTRELLIEIMKKNNIPHEERNIPESELYEADEIWMSGSSKEILPIIELNNKPLGTGKVGPVWEKVAKIFFEYKKELYEQQKEEVSN